MDGNGRWAEKRGLPRFEGHRIGAETVARIVKSCVEKNILVLSLFAFSSENWLRPQQEVDFLMQLVISSLAKEIKELHKHKVVVRFTGDRKQLSQQLCRSIAEAEKLTKNNQGLILNILLNYGGKWDIVQAAKNMAQKIISGSMNIDEITEDTFATFLSTYGLPDPDLFIRTSGEQRISNFFLWQLAYTELYFSKTHWPDFSNDEFEKALACFSKRNRRYGHV